MSNAFNEKAVHWTQTTAGTVTLQEDPSCKKIQRMLCRFDTHKGVWSSYLPHDDKFSTSSSTTTHIDWCNSGD